MLLAAAATLILAVAPGSAGATAKSPAWSVFAITGPTHLPVQQSQVQRLTVEGEEGTFSLTVPNLSSGSATPKTGNINLEITAGSTAAKVLSGTTELGQRVVGGGLATGTTVAACSVEPCGAGATVTLSAPATSTKANLSAKTYFKEMIGYTGNLNVGDEISGTGLAAGTRVTAIIGSTLQISKYPETVLLGAVALTGAEVVEGIPFNAPAPELQGDLEALPAYEPEMFSVTGGPGGSGATPYLIAFGARYADRAAPSLVVHGEGLVGARAFAQLFTTVPGGPGTGQVVIYTTNLGGAASTGVVTVKLGPLPPGVTATGPGSAFEGWNCTGGGTEVSCELPSGAEALRAPFAIVVPVEVTSPLGFSATAPVSLTEAGGPTVNVTAPIVVSQTPAEPGIAGFLAGAFEANGEPSMQAGGHPYSQITAIAFNTVRSGSGKIVPAADARNLEIELPPGFLGNPLLTQRCPQSQINCYTASVDLGDFAAEYGALGSQRAHFPLENDVPVFGAAAQFSTKAVAPVQSLLGSLRSESDFGITVTAPNAATVFDKIYETVAVFEGLPAAAGGKAFFRNPTDCAAQAREAPAVRLLTTSWQRPSVPYSPAVAPQRAVTGCERLEFHAYDPSTGKGQVSFGLQPTSTQGSSAVGATAHLHIDQSGLSDPAKLGTPDLKRSEVQLPAGLAINPSQANGLAACSEAQMGYQAGAQPLPFNPTRFNDQPVSCPDASKLGTVEVKTPLLEEPLQGTIYLAAQEENPFHSLIALYLVIESPRFGINLKLPGKVETDPSTGQVSAAFDYIPQQPVEDLVLHFRGGGPRSEFATPEVCGTYATHGEWEPWSAPESGAPAQTSDSFAVSSGCSSSTGTRPFHPTFEGGSVNPLAGVYSPLVIKINRNDGEQELKSLDFTLPPGETGRLAGIPYCPEGSIAEASAKTGREELASSSCPAASQVGTVDAGAGVGSEPVHVGGKVYLAGPYRGAPLSAVVITPAVSGPFDLGDVVIRSPLFVNPESAQITAKSDPIPTILRGIPLKIRSVVISIDRSGFTLNPTNCEAMSIYASLGSSDGATATPTNRFQVANCAKLGFKPELKLSLKGSTKHAGHPALKAVLTYPKQGAYANVARAQVNLPHSEFIDQGNLNKTCTKPLLLEGKCPAKSIYGKAKAWTPLLEKPLEGPVYLVGGYGYKLPALVAELNGQIRVLLVGKVDSGPNKGIRSTFGAVPDAPVSRFVLQMKGGPKYSLLENSENLCQKPQRAIANFKAQNGRVDLYHPKIQVKCKKKHKKAPKLHRHR
jgi:hypothetical protein